MSSALRKRVGSGVLSQAVASGSNLLVSLFAARELSLSGFGSFAAAYSVYIALVGLHRALILEPALGRRVPSLDADRRVISSSVGASAAAASVLVIVGLLLGNEFGRAIFLLGLVLPVLAVLDAGRYLAFSNQQPSRALAIDVAWAVAIVVGFGASVQFSISLSAPAVIGLWGAASLAGVVLVARWWGLAPPGLSWMLECWSIGWRYSAQWAATTGAAQVALLGLGVFAGVGAVGAVRGGQLLFGPLNVLFAGFLAVVIAEGARLSDSRLLRLAAATSALYSMVAAALTGVLVFMPDQVGESLLGASWQSANAVLVPIGLSAVMGAIAAGPIGSLRSLMAADTTLRITVITAPLYLFVPVAMAVQAGSVGFAWGLFVCSSWSALVWWVGFGLRVSGRVESRVELQARG